MLCVRGFVFYGLCCLFQIGAGLSRVSMLLLMIACSSIRGAPTVFKCVWHVLDATLDQPGTAMQTRLRPGAQACTVSTGSGAVCVRGFVFRCAREAADLVCRHLLCDCVAIYGKPRARRREGPRCCPTRCERRWAGSF